jgi:hypothetical protein
MTQEALKKMYQLLLTEPHAPTVCAQLEVIAREALAQTQEPVAWRAPRWSNLQGEYGYRDFNDPVIDISTGKPSLHNEPLYTHPPQRTWVGLTADEIWDEWLEQSKPERNTHNFVVAFTRAIEAKLKEKNT